jgi:putative porin
MLRFLSVPLLLALASAAAAQEAQPVYQQKKSSSAFHLDGVSRQEWTDEVTFVAKSRRLIRLKPRLEFNSNWLQVGVGGDFNYGSDHNTDPPEGMTTLPLLRDNYKSRDARLDLAFAKLTPVRFLSVQGGRFPMPVRFTEMIWDRDLRVQGGAATVDFGAVGPLQRFAVTGVYSRGSHIFPDDGAFHFGDRDVIWIGSATATFSAGAKDRIELTGAYLKFDDLGFVDSRLRRQNTRVGGVLIRPYEVLDFVARYHGEGRVSTTLAADYCWNTAVDTDNRGLWIAVLLGSTITARGSLEYTYAQVDKDATLAAYTTDDFIWGTGWGGHRLDLGVRMSDRASSHIVGQLQKFKDSPIAADRDTNLKRVRVEVRFSY